MKYPILLLLVACQHVPDHSPTLAELSAMGDEDKAGKWLMSSSPGLLRLDAPVSPHDTAIIAVHGYRSEGSEWVEPLTKLAAWGDELYFYRWDWNQCPTPAAQQLDAAIGALVTADPSIQHLVIVGHSYGGLVTGILGQKEPLPRPAQLQLIAAPLAGHPQLEKLCKGDGMGSSGPAEGVRWHQWRTVQASDGAFKDLDTDPQIVTLPELEVTQLPAEWEGGRLGHNRSIQWVVAELGKASSPNP